MQPQKPRRRVFTDIIILAGDEQFQRKNSKSLPIQDIMVTFAVS